MSRTLDLKLLELLGEQAFNDSAERSEYWNVLELLHKIPFYWTTYESDANRVGDALSFRQYDFVYLCGLHPIPFGGRGGWFESAPSVLEVLMAVARRWMLFFDNDIHLFFGHLFTNLGLRSYSWMTQADAGEVRSIVDRWMSRQFKANGVGSPFPVRHPSFLDQRTQPIWDQMNAYSMEHFR